MRHRSTENINTPRRNITTPEEASQHTPTSTASCRGDYPWIVSGYHKISFSDGHTFSSVTTKWEFLPRYSARCVCPPSIAPRRSPLRFGQ
ncbi:hypothetical protein DM01DRAFT_1186744 [Hesseltinella vesiculosa]|uniref:Uncharacterized protein n=1 Tax=Hesseltinella vesiculosa TaxID=101127 RepID=A0A1X2GQN3_9FUNG|nr:hypothetical protein DM01DRAFT_1186744 [Hesseltinella vesiculosa]